MADQPTQRDDEVEETHLPPSSELLWNEFRMLALLIVVVAAGTVFVLATGVFLLAFASVLVAVVLHDLSAQLARHSPLSHQWALTVVFLLFLGLAGTFTWLTAPNLMNQAGQVAERIPQAFNAIDDWLSGWLGGAELLSVRELMPAARSLIGNLPMIVTTTFGALGSLVVIFALGLYMASDPGKYRDGVVMLFARPRRREVRETLNEIGTALSRWMQGQLIAMVLMGVLSYAALKALGVPLALTLALITGLLELVPYIGAIVAAIPVILVALTESWQLALYALVAYTLLQMIEGYAMVPLIQRRAISVPPGIILFSQVLLGVLFGVVGIVLATPIAGAVAVVLRRNYMGSVVDDSERG